MSNWQESNVLRNYVGTTFKRLFVELFRRCVKSLVPVGDLLVRLCLISHRTTDEAHSGSTSSRLE
jgi:hypothetical protein